MIFLLQYLLPLDENPEKEILFKKQLNLLQFLCTIVSSNSDIIFQR